MRALVVNGQRISAYKAIPGVPGRDGTGIITLQTAVALPATGIVDVTVLPDILDGDVIFGQVNGVECFLTRTGGFRRLKRFIPGLGVTNLPSGAAFRPSAFNPSLLPIGANASIPTSGFVDLTIDIPTQMQGAAGQTYGAYIKGVGGTLVKQAAAGIYRFTPLAYPSAVVPVVGGTDVAALFQITPITNPLTIGGASLADQNYPGWLFGFQDLNGRSYFAIDTDGRAMSQGHIWGDWRMDVATNGDASIARNGVNVVSFKRSSGKAALSILNDFWTGYDDPAYPGFLEFISNDNRRMASWHPLTGFTQIQPYGQGRKDRRKEVVVGATGVFETVYSSGLDTWQVFYTSLASSYPQQLTTTGDHYELSTMSNPDKLVYIEEIKGEAIAYWSNPDGTQRAPLVASSDIVLLGDSTSTDPFYYSLALKVLYPNRAIFNLGIGGQTTKQISGRFGGAVVTMTGIAGNSIPTTATPVTLNIEIQTIANRVIKGLVNGSMCELTRTPGGTYTIRSLTGSAVSAPGGTVFVPKTNHFLESNGESEFSLDALKGKTLLFWTGRNDSLGNPVNTVDIVADAQAVINQLSSYAKRWLVIGPTNGIGDTEASYGGAIATGATSNQRLLGINQINTAFATAFGDRYVNILAHLQAQPGATVAVTPTGSGNNYTVLRGTNADQTGGALLLDGIHVNQAGGNIVAARVKAILDQKGW